MNVDPHRDSECRNNLIGSGDNNAAEKHEGKLHAAHPEFRSL